MWLWIIIIAVIIGALIGLFSTGRGESAGENVLGGAMAGGCLAAGCLVRIFIFGVVALILLALFFKLFT